MFVLVCGCVAEVCVFLLVAWLVGECKCMQTSEMLVLT